MQERLPRVLQGGPETKLRKLLDVISAEMVRMAQGTTGLMRSRWVGLARGWQSPQDDLAQKQNTELAQIGRLLGCLPRARESTLQFRRRLLEFVAIHREGLGTARSLLRLVALVYGAEHPPRITIKEDMTTEAEFEVPDRQERQCKLKLKLLDNPMRTNRIDPTVFDPITDDGSQRVLVIENQGVYAAFPRIELTAREKDVAVPMLFNRQTGQMVMYVGQVPKGSRLTLENGKPPLLDNLLRKKFLQNYAGFNQAHFCPSSSKVQAQFAVSDVEKIDALLNGYAFQFNKAQFYSSEAKHAARFARFGGQLEFPKLPPGKSEWGYTTLRPEQLYYYIENLPAREKLLSHALNQPPPRVKLSFVWQEHLSACFALRIVPDDYVPPFMHSPDELQQAIERALNYGKAAGVQFKLGDKWP